MRMWAYWKLITLTAVDPKDSCPSWNRFVPFQDLPESQVAALSSHLILIITKAQISLSKSSKLGIDETHYIIHPQAKFHSICESVKLENILSAPQIQQLVKDRISVINRQFRKERMESKKRKKRGHHFKIQLGKQPFVPRPGDNPLQFWLCWTPGTTPGLHTWRFFPFSQRVVCVCSWLVLSACFLPVEFWESNSISSSVLSNCLRPTWQCDHWHTVLKNLVNLLVCLRDSLY